MKTTGAQLITQLLERLVRQLRKLEDVIEIHRDPDAHAAFAAVARHVV
jgi:hypothetical protein